jgi:hypothetical protein
MLIPMRTTPFPEISNLTFGIQLGITLAPKPSALTIKVGISLVFDRCTR